MQSFLEFLKAFEAVLLPLTSQGWFNEMLVRESPNRAFRVAAENFARLAQQYGTRLACSSCFSQLSAMLRKSMVSSTLICDFLSFSDVPISISEEQWTNALARDEAAVAT